MLALLALIHTKKLKLIGATPFRQRNICIAQFGAVEVAFHCYFYAKIVFLCPGKYVEMIMSGENVLYCVFSTNSGNYLPHHTSRIMTLLFTNQIQQSHFTFHGAFSLILIFFYIKVSVRETAEMLAHEMASR